MKINGIDIAGVSESLFIPLFFRVRESRRPDAIVVDKKAVEIQKRLNQDFLTVSEHSLAHIATMMRVRQFDKIIASLLEKEPDTVVVNIGCGLDSRFFRIDNGNLTWYELDFPQVIRLRKLFFQQNSRYQFIGRDVLDFAWLNLIDVKKDKPPVFIAEGVFMYLAEKKVKKLIKVLGCRFPEAILVFDAVSPTQVFLSYFNPAITTTSARFRWGLVRAEDLQKWGPHINFIKAWYYFDKPVPRLGFLNFFKNLPHISRGMFIIMCQLGEPKKKTSL